MKKLLIFLTFVLVSCSTKPPERLFIRSEVSPDLPLMTDAPFGEQVDLDPIESIFALSDEQREKFLSEINLSDSRNEATSLKLTEYLKKIVKKFNFYSDTLNANQSISEQKGNCLSLAILTKSLADIVNVPVSFELVSTFPVYQKEGGVVLSSQHLRSRLYESGQSNQLNYNLLWLGNTVIDYFPEKSSKTLRSVSLDEFHSMYYRNKAAEFMIVNNDDAAYWYLRKALEIYPEDNQVLNMLAVLYTRKGEYGVAEELYRYALTYGPEFYELLSNYNELLKRLKRFDEVKIIEKRLSTFKYPDPFKWVDLGNTAVINRNYSDAKEYFIRAIMIADYVHEAYFGLAQVSFNLGDFSEAKRYLKQAIEKSNNPNITDIYNAKLAELDELSD